MTLDSPDRRPVRPEGYISDATKGLKMPNLNQTEFVEPIRELTLNEVEAVSGGADGGGPAPVTCPCGCNTPFTGC
jgi:hypothetical protein